MTGSAASILRVDGTNVPDRPLISVIVPVFNEEETLPTFHQTLSKVLEDLSGAYDFELLFTDNCSTDGTYSILESLAASDPRIRVLRFSRNFGYQRSLYTGYVNARGDAAIQLDCDLQDPPELMKVFLEKWREGHDVVYGVRKSRKEGISITLVRRIFYHLIDMLSDDELPRDAGDFRLISRRVIEALRVMDDSHPYLRGFIASIGFSQVGIPYDRQERFAGESKFSFGQLLYLSIDGILVHSITPLRFATLTAFVMSIVTFLGIVTYAGGRLLFGTDWPAGFATTTVLLLLGITLNALFLGVIGEYLGRIYQQVKRRPISIVERSIDRAEPGERL